jgi:hypothetical protein
MPWQSYLGRFVEAIGQDDEWLYAEIAALVSRQQGKTKFILPHIMRRLKMGRRVLHAGNQRELPRLTFNVLAPLVEARWPDAKVRRGSGQESMEVPGGGVYRITAASSGGPRGWSMDDLIVDEVREIGEDFIQAAIPTMMASPNPQTLYLSNAGHNESTVLNAIRARSGEDQALAYLEWSAAPSRAADDMDGWLEANPAIGHLPGVIRSLERVYASHKLAGTLRHFETENLCRWVPTRREQLVNEASWLLCKVPDVGRPILPSMAVSMDPAGQRASIATAWRKGDGVALRLVENVTGNPLDTDALGTQVKQIVGRLGVKKVGGDSLTDAELLKYVKKPRLVVGKEYAAACAQFVNLVNAGKLYWSDADPVTDDLTWTSKKPDGDDGSYHAVRAEDDRPIPASLAAIRAVWLASGPVPATPRVM